MGNVVSAGLGQNPARQAALRGGLADHVAALTINKVCGSGLKAVMLAAQGIATGDIEIAVAGGMESMSNCPYLLPRRPRRLRHGQRHARRLDDQRRPVVRVRELPHGQLPARSSPSSTTSAAQAQDAFAAREPPEGGARHARRAAFTDEILPIAIPQKKGSADRGRPRRVDPRATRPWRRSRALKPAFKKDGTVTAGNAPGVNDGASALVVMSGRRARGARPAPARPHRRHRRRADSRRGWC